MTMQTAAVSPNPLSQALSAPPPRGTPVDTQVDAQAGTFGAALKAAGQSASYSRQAATDENKGKAVADGNADDGIVDPAQAANPLDPQWLANFAAMVGHLQPLHPVQPASPPVDTIGIAASTAPGAAAALLPPALTGVTADPADAQEETPGAADDAALAELADSTSSPRAKRSAGVATAADASASTSAKSVPADVSDTVPRSQEASRAQAPAAASAVPMSFAAKTEELHTEAAVAPTAAVADGSAPAPGAPTHGQGIQATLARAEVPTVPGAAASLHGQALQGRLDDALRWMAGNGVQTAQIKVTPAELGPITVHLQLNGDIAHVMFSSAHEQTRQVLESSLGGLRDALAAGGLSLGQASVGSEQQQRNMFAGTESGERRESDSAPAFSITDGGTANPGSTAAIQRPSSPARPGDGLVNLYA